MLGFCAISEAPISALPVVVEVQDTRRPGSTQVRKRRGLRVHIEQDFTGPDLEKGQRLPKILPVPSEIRVDKHWTDGVRFKVIPLPPEPEIIIEASPEDETDEDRNEKALRIAAEWKAKRKRQRDHRNRIAMMLFLS